MKFARWSFGKTGMSTEEELLKGILKELVKERLERDVGIFN